MLVQLSNTYISEGKEHEIPGALNMKVYLELNDEMTQNIRFCDLDGNTVELPEVQESTVINRKPPRLEWML